MNAVSNINTLDDAAKVLEEGHLVQRNGESISTSIMHGNREFPVVFTIWAAIGSTRTPHMEITCELGKLAEIFPVEDQSKAFVTAMLALSLTPATPYGVGLLAGEDGIDDDDPIILHNQVPLGDFSPAEMESAMDSLRQAITLAVASLGINTD